MSVHPFNVFSIYFREFEIWIWSEEEHPQINCIWFHKINAPNTKTQEMNLFFGPEHFRNKPIEDTQAEAGGQRVENMVWTADFIFPSINWLCAYFSTTIVFFRDVNLLATAATKSHYLDFIHH